MQFHHIRTNPPLIEVQIDVILQTPSPDTEHLMIIPFSVNGIAAAAWKKVGKPLFSSVPILMSTFSAMWLEGRLFSLRFCGKLLRLLRDGLAEWLAGGSPPSPLNQTSHPASRLLTIQSENGPRRAGSHFSKPIHLLLNGNLMERRVGVVSPLDEVWANVLDDSFWFLSIGIEGSWMGIRVAGYNSLPVFH